MKFTKTLSENGFEVSRPLIIFRWNKTIFLWCINFKRPFHYQLFALAINQIIIECSRKLVKDVCYLKNQHSFWTMGAPLFYVHSAFCVDDIKWFSQLRIHNSEKKILIQYHIVWLLVVIFSGRATREAMQDFPSDKKRRKEWEDACGRIKLSKNPLLFSLHFSPDAFESFSRPQLLTELTNDWDKKR